MLLHPYTLHTVSQNVLHTKITKITTQNSALSTLINNQLQTLLSNLGFNVNIPALPYNMTIDKVTTDTAGVTITATANHVVLAS